MPYVGTSEGDIFFTVKSGPTEGPRLVLLHGAGGSRLHWPAGLRQLVGATVYTLDLPGHGRSEGQGCEAISCYADVVAAFLDAAGLDRVTVVGHSMGGAIAQTLALDHSRRVSAVGLIATGARLRVSPVILETIQQDFERAVELITRYAWSPQADASLTDLGRDALQDTGPDVLLNDFLACDRFDVMDRLDEIQVPALVVSGTADRLTPAKYARFLTERIPNTRLVTVDGAGHMVMLERPEVVTEAIRDFVPHQR